MWPYTAVPKPRIKTKYAFEISDAWLNHLQLASVRFKNGSGAFVSADGLVLTNQHIASDCLQNLSTAGHDYVKEGFYAKSQEPRCPDLELNVVQQITDVTAQMNMGVKVGMPEADIGKLQRAATAKIEKECATAADVSCEVVSLYSGALFYLYKYKKYTDVRLVFAPEFDASNFRVMTSISLFFAFMRAANLSIRQSICSGRSRVCKRANWSLSRVIPAYRNGRIR